MVGTIGWGIAGCGWVGRDFAAPAIAASGNSRLIALHDPIADAVETIAPHDAALVRSTDYDAFLRTPGLQAVYVAAPNHVHRRLVEAAAAAGHAILCEKPMALTAVDGRAMVQACERHNVFYATAFDQRFHPAHQQVATMIAAGAVGRVSAIRILYACWVGSNWSCDNWRIDPARAGGGAFFDLAPHGLDLVTTVLGEPIATAHALGQFHTQDYARAADGVDDGAMVIARTASGVLVQLHIAYNCPEFLPRRRLEIVGDHGQLTLTDTMGQTPGGSMILQTDETGPQDVTISNIEISPFARQIKAFADHLLDVRPFGFWPQDDLPIMDLLERLRDDINRKR